jgi:hypothetical protein
MKATTAPNTVAECDRRLLSAYAAYVLATDRGDLVEADAAYLLLDALLDLRLHIPLQREP